MLNDVGPAESESLQANERKLIYTATRRAHTTSGHAQSQVTFQAHRPVRFWLPANPVNSPMMAASHVT